MDEAEGSELQLPFKRSWLAGPKSSYWLTRFAFFRLLGLVYFVAFLSLAVQLPGLIGSNGLLPVHTFLARVQQLQHAAAYIRLPTLFWMFDSDTALSTAAWLGAALALGVALGFANAFVLGALWILYVSFVHVGQIFWGFGWEMLLCETGFLAIFLAPISDARPTARSAPPVVVVWLLRWLAFRVMFGAGLIKLRGDDCWMDLSCLNFFYETQPLPNALSRFWHLLPGWAHATGVLANHFAELVAPWGVFGPRKVRHTAGIVIIAFQLLLILGGNLSFLNYLTIAVALSCFDDSILRRLFPSSMRTRFAELAATVHETRARRAAVVVLGVLIGALSLNPIVNMLSSHQAMNASFDPLGLVNTYGAFGSVERRRREVVIEGTDAEGPDDEGATWKAYELPCKPGDLDRRPCWCAPYHYRLDWQLWFAALSEPEDNPWLVRLVYELLSGNHAVTALFARNPFPDRPPRWIRVRRFIYEFSPPGRPATGPPGLSPNSAVGRWWSREPSDEYLRPLSLDDPDLKRVAHDNGWDRRRQGHP